jgi:hypothetical protein
MDSNTVLRLGAAGLLGLVLFGAAFALHGRDVPEPIRVFPAVVPADQLAAELTRFPSAFLTRPPSSPKKSWAMWSPPA